MKFLSTITRINHNTQDIQEINAQRRYARAAVHKGLVHEQEEFSPFHGDLIYHQMFNYQSNEIEEELYFSVPMAWHKNSDEVHIYIDAGFDMEMYNQVQAILKYNPNILVKFKSLIYQDQKLHKMFENGDFHSFFTATNKDDLIYLNQRFNKVSKANHNYNLNYHFSPETIGGLSDETPITTDYEALQPVILESPFAGDIANNVLYAKIAINLLSKKGYAPTASHLHYTQMLDDSNPLERKLGIDRGINIAKGQDSLVVLDRGMSGGMKYGIERAINEGRKVFYQTISDDPQIIQDIASISDLKDAEMYCEYMQNQNKELYQKTGFIIPNNFDQPTQDENFKFKV